MWLSLEKRAWRKAWSGNAGVREGVTRSLNHPFVRSGTILARKTQGFDSICFALIDSEIVRDFRSTPVLALAADIPPHAW